MKVKDFIKELMQLDQDKEIYLVYDGVYVSDPSIEVAEEDVTDQDKCYKKGDYLINAW